MQQLLIGQYQSHHRLDHGRAPDAYARVMATLGDNVRCIAITRHRFNWREDGRRWFERNTHQHRLPR